MSRDHIDIGDRLPARYISEGRPRNSKWHLREPIIRKHAGRIHADDIARIIGVSRGCLSGMCSKHKISLKVPGRMSESIARMHQRRKRKSATINLNRLWKPTSAGAQQ